MKKKLDIALGFYQDSNTAQEVLNKLRREGFNHSLSIHRLHTGEIQKSLFNPTNSDLFITICLLMAILAAIIIAHFHLTSMAVIFTGGTFLAWVLFHLYYYFQNIKTFRKFENSVIRDETLVIAKVHEKDVRKAISIMRKVESYHPISFLLSSSPQEEIQKPFHSSIESLPTEGLKQHAMDLAQTLKNVSFKKTSTNPLKISLEKKAKLIADTRYHLLLAEYTEQIMDSSAEWFLDNMYIIQNCLEEIRRGLSFKYYQELPKVISGPMKGLPRIYVIAKELIDCTKFRLNRENINAFLNGYLSVEDLTSGELWALPLMLKLSLLEYIQKLASQMQVHLHEGELASYWGNRLLNLGKREPQRLVAFLQDLKEQFPNPSAHYIEELLNHIYDESTVLPMLSEWIENSLGLTPNEILKDIEQQKTIDEVAFSSAIISLITLSQLTWNDIFEEMSPVDAILKNDPARIYASMDFATRDIYRHALEDIACGSNHSERDIAESVIKMAQNGYDEITKHVGYYLIDEGRNQLEAQVNCRPANLERLQRWMRKHSTLVYLGGIGICIGLIEGGLACLSLNHGETLTTTSIFLLAALFPVSEIAVQILNFVIPLFIPPFKFPKMNFEKRIPQIDKSLVVTPSMLLNQAGTDKLINQLEIQYLANPDPALKFALLLDYADAQQETVEEDKLLLENALRGMQNLEIKYGVNKFFLFLRSRVWSKSESAWIGWERKRGKLEILNRFLIGDIPQDNFLQFGNPAELTNIRYVITLDSDNHLPKDTAKELIETISHPLNRPKINENNRIVRGYAILQPSVCTDFTQPKETFFLKLFSDSPGIDPYTQTVSDIYQDLMLEGTYHGKGIYDLYAFNKLLSGKLPEEQILSHDLLEGALTKVGYASNILLFDHFPKDYLSWSQRQHRWYRGDWQIFDWLFPTVKIDGKKKVNPLSVINRWKIFDNLRRALLLPAIFFLLIAAWLTSSSAPIWTLLSLLALVMPALAMLLNQRCSSLNALVDSSKQFCNAISRIAVNISLIPQQVKTSLDALGRSLYRRLISHRKLLEWSYHHSASTVQYKGLIYFLCTVAVLSFCLTMLIDHLNPAAIPYALPFTLLWMLSPLIVTLLDSKQLIKTMQAGALSDEHRLYLRKIARRTWRYFDDFVNDQSNWLPPDNYQAALNVEVAQRTSPTNIGLWLLTIISANDLNYLSCDAAIEKLKAALQSLQKLELYEGHLLNWYETHSLKALLPRYVSTVDNGNFLASLWTLEQAINQLLNKPVLPLLFAEGLQDTYMALIEAKNTNTSFEQFQALQNQLFIKPKTVWEAITSIKTDSALIEKYLEINNSNGEEAYWLKKLSEQIKDAESCYQRYLYWIEILEEGSRIELPLSHQVSLNELLSSFRQAPSLIDLASKNAFKSLNLFIGKLQRELNLLSNQKDWLNRLLEAIHKAEWFAGEQIHQAHELLTIVNSFSNIDMSLLYNPDRRLFTIGYNVDEGKADSSHYDLLASEARISSLVSIAKGDVPIEHWWALGRPYRKVNGLDALVSWSGTMFEYLMPLLFMKNDKDSLLGNACKNALTCQIAYANNRGIPWGISEAAFSEIDAHKTYQYRSFGVPGLGFKRGLEEDLVLSPYSTGLALSLDPAACIKNFQALSRDHQNLYSDYGFYESIDYAREQGPKGERGLIVYAYMAHHQGMILLAINNCLHNAVMVERFHHNPSIKGVESLLYERIPLFPPITKEYRKQIPVTRLTPISDVPIMGVMKTTESTSPKVNLLSNGSYSVMLTNSGGGYSKWKDNDITRWRADTTCDSWGSFCYIKDIQSGKFWSTTFHPTGNKGQNFNVHFKADKVEFTRKDEEIVTTTSITVSPQDNVEVRLIVLANLSKRERTLELTSYQELALAPHTADRAHPSFNKLFIQTEGQQLLCGLLAFRRLRSKDDLPLWTGHVVASSQIEHQPLEFETDRGLFIGRGNTLENPAAMHGNLKNSTGYVLDPIFSLRRKVILAPGQRMEIAFVTAAADNREAIIQLIEKYKELSVSKLTFEMAWTHAQLELRHLRIDQEETQLFQKLASRILYPHSQLRISAERLRKNQLGQSSLWKYGISGDLPIVALTISESHELDLVKQVLAAHTFWKLRGLKVDCVILNEESYSYEQPLFGQINRLIYSQARSHGIEIGKSGGIYLLNIEQMPSEDVTLILSIARAHLIASRGYLRQHLVSPMQPTTYPPNLANKSSHHEHISKPLPFMELPYFNGIGGYTLDGKEYAIYLEANRHTPAPWINVISNEKFGMIVSETGLGTTWYGNSQSNRLTNWSNDALINPITDAIYLRDEKTGTFWTATPGPIRELDAYRIRHGQGYSCFEHNSHGIEQELTIFVPVDENGGQPLRIQRLRLKNSSGHRRTISLFTYSELVLGGDREETQMHLITDWDERLQVLFASNSYTTEYKGNVVFTYSTEPIVSYTGNRTEFIGRNKNTSNPAALQRVYLSRLTGVGYDPCAALHVQVELDIDEEKEIAFILGYAAEVEEANKIVSAYKHINDINSALAATKKWWDHQLEVIQIESPEQFINFTMNRWLPYQNLSCRLWGRSAFYQSSGAYGFRDQLQDVMALLYTKPQIAREQILRAASRQFIEGDVQHWWLPPSNGGVRTRISDDLLWLPFVTAQYIRVTKDVSILSENVPFIKGELLTETQHELFFIPDIADERATLLEHCRRAVHKGNTKGSHGLPLIGGGDWNDGMNRVGIEGLGESVWLAWFLIHVLNDFCELLELSGNFEESKKYKNEAKELVTAIETNAWDGNWYKRAFFDDGTPLGSATNQEDKIDSLPQSWAVITGGGDSERAKRSLAAVEKELIRQKEGLVLLLTPAFNETAMDPGYIKGYPPGIRENGGQYTHGSLWVPLAFARLGNGDKAVEILKMMHPTMHTTTPEQINIYKIEPYVLAGDVYSAEGKEGRGGWSWYTGSAGWMYRIWLEEILGFQLRGNILSLNPNLPKNWPQAKINYRFQNTLYQITIRQSGDMHDQKIIIELDKQRISNNEIILIDDANVHQVEVEVYV